MNSIILINKPAGMTSFKVTASVRKKLNIKKAGHAGTLDPMASGVLPVMTGRATKIIDLINDNKKRYIADILLGLTTDTLDSEGEALTDQPVNVSKEQFIAAANKFVGEIQQIPPMYSALKKDGQKLYELARKGQTVERKPRNATIFSLSVLQFSKDTATIDVTCSKGTYIRTLIDDIGMSLCCGAIMTRLQRVYSNGFDISQCVDYNDFMNGNAQDFAKPVDFALLGFDAVYVTKPQAKRFVNGGELSLQRIKNCGKTELLRVYSENIFLGLGKISDNELKPECVIAENNGVFDA